MKYFLIGVLFIISLIIYINVRYCESYKIGGKVIDKSITSNRNGNVAYYHVLVLYDDGETEDITGVDNFIKFEKGVRYIFTEHRLNFSKK